MATKIYATIEDGSESLTISGSLRILSEYERSLNHQPASFIREVMAAAMAIVDTYHQTGQGSAETAAAIVKLARVLGAE